MKVLNINLADACIQNDLQFMKYLKDSYSIVN